MRRRTRSEITRKEWVTGLATAAAGAINGAGLMVLSTPALLGLNSFWELYVTSCLLGGALFPVLTVSVTNPISFTVIGVTRRADALAEVLASLIQEYGLATVTTPLGIAVGLVLWLVFGALLIPFLLIAVDRGAPFTLPHLGLDLFIGYAVYGLSLGGFYGLIVQEPDVRRRVVRLVRPSG
jgi:hypothetical protein